MLVIGGGYSVSGYDKAKLYKLAGNDFTFSVNDSAFKWPTDIVVACDSDWINLNFEKLIKLDKPIVTRDWGNAIKPGLMLFELPNDVVNIARLSGQVAVKLADSLANVGGLKSYVIGIDHSCKGHYYDKKQVYNDLGKLCSLQSYADLACTNTINLGAHSLVDCWPMQFTLPNTAKLTAKHRCYLTLALKISLKKHIYKGITQ